MSELKMLPVIFSQTKQQHQNNKGKTSEEGDMYDFYVCML